MTDKNKIFEKLFKNYKGDQKVVISHQSVINDALFSNYKRKIFLKGICLNFYILSSIRYDITIDTHPVKCLLNRTKKETKIEEKTPLPIQHSNLIFVYTPVIWYESN